MEQCTEPFDAVKKLMRQRYDAVIVDWENEANATLVLKNARMSPANKTSLAVAIVEGQTSVRNAFRAGANFVLYKPISLEQAKTSLRAARALMQRGAEAAAKGQGAEAAGPGPTLVPPADFAAKAPATSGPSTSTFPSRMATVTPMPAPQQPFSSPSMSSAETSWGNAGTAAAPAKEGQGASVLDELRSAASTALDNLNPAAEGITSKTTSVIDPAKQGTKTDMKPFPTTVKPKSNEEDGFYRLDLDADPATSSAAPKKSPQKAPEFHADFKSTVESARVPVAPATPATPAAAEPELQVVAEPVTRRGISFDEVRSRVAAQIPRSVPSFGVGDGEEKSGGIPKPVLLGGAAVVVFVIVIFALVHLRSGRAAQPVAQAVPQQQQQATVAPPDSTTVTATPLPSGQATVPAQPVVTPIPQMPLKGDVKTGKEILPKPSAGKAVTAPAEPSVQGDEATAEAEPEVQVHKLIPAEKPKQKVQEAEAAPPSVDAVSGTAVSSVVGGIMDTPVSVPKLVAPDRVRVSQGVSQGMISQMVKPQYPAAARAMRLQGAVVMEALIGKDGSVKNLKILKGHPMLAKAATDAVKQWHYKPYLLNGQPVDVETQITVNFMP